MDEKSLIQDNLDEGITLIELFNSLKQNIFLLLGITILVVAIGVFYTWFVVTPMYTSSVDVQISNVNENVTTVNQIKNNVKEIVKYTDIAKVVVLELDIPYSDLDVTAKQIAKRVSSSDIGSAAAIKVSYQDKDPVQATKIVIAIATEAARRVNIPKSEEESLAFSEETLSLINKPREDVNQAPSSPNKMLNLAISIILGGIIAVVIIILKEQFSSYFKTKREVEKYTNISVIAMIPGSEGGKFGE